MRRIISILMNGAMVKNAFKSAIMFGFCFIFVSCFTSFAMPRTRHRLLPYLSWFIFVIWSLFLGRISQGLTWVTNSTRLRQAYLLEYEDHPLRKDNPLQYLSFLKGKTVVFIGDSLTRYQFLSLANFLHRNSWDEESGIPSILIDAEHHRTNRWPNFYYQSTIRMGCSHLCDCVRVSSGRTYYKMHEHMYHYHVGLDFFMSFHFFTPTLNFTFYRADHLTRKELLNNCRTSRDSLESLKFIVDPHEVHRSYTPENIAQFIETEIKAMEPSAVFFNQGLWKSDSFRNASSLVRLAAAMLNATPLPFWKATTQHYLVNETLTEDSEAFLRSIQSYGLGLYDTYAVTEKLFELFGQKVCYDGSRHFFPFVYREANIVLLELLQISFSTNYSSLFPLVGHLPNQMTRGIYMHEPK